MLAHLAEVSIRSILLAVAAASFLCISRHRRTAALRHAVWTAVVCGMLALCAFGQFVPRIPLRILDDSTRAIPMSQTAVTTQPPLPDAEKMSVSVPAPEHRRIRWRTVVAYTYAGVAVAFLARFVTGLFFVRRLVAASRPASRGFSESDAVTVPVTVGCFRPRVILPPEWRRWDGEKLDAILTHEGAHVRRRDGLIAALAHVNRCIFWFHPLAWVLERKLARLAEQSCDESSVAALGDRHRYANLLLEMATMVDGTRGRLRCHALTMAASSQIRQRIESLFQEGKTFSRGLTWAGWVTVILCGIPLVWGAGAVELARQPPLLSLEMPKWSVPAPPIVEQKSVMLPVKVAQALPTQTTPAQSPATASPLSFEVASVKEAGTSMPNGFSTVPRRSGGRITWATNLTLIFRYAYHLQDWQMSGLGSTDSFYVVEAKTDESATDAQIRLMFQTLLADRFKVRFTGKPGSAVGIGS
jgi:beta-lactamase regulating signal transducer with metallopeptidase domain